MTQDERGLVEDLADAIEGKAVWDYSGRGMYGATCAAIYCADQRQAIEEAVEYGLRGGLIDNMGKGYVIYWPKLETAPTPERAS